MATTLLLIRHGKTKWNSLGKFQGCIDIELSDEGISQANILRARLENSFDYIYTSPLKRALKTANIISSNMDLEPIIESSLREIDFGEWEGLTLKEMEELYPEDFKIWIDDEIEAPLCGGDLSTKAVSLRAKEGILNLVKKHKDKTIVIVSHTGITKAGLIALFDWNMTMYHKIELGNTAICKLTFNDDLYPVLLSLNDTSHLDNETKPEVDPIPDETKIVVNQLPDEAKSDVSQLTDDTNDDSSLLLYDSNDDTSRLLGDSNDDIIDQDDDSVDDTIDQEDDSDDDTIDQDDDSVDDVVEEKDDSDDDIRKLFNFYNF
jgi:probable phosphoglycerate mutase